MNKQIFINLPVSNLLRSMELYTRMGFNNNPQFSDDTAKCMVWSEHIFVMLMTRERFAGFASKPVADTKANQYALLSVSLESVDKMNEVAEAAKAAGATEPVEMKDYGFMVQRTLEDFDGHTWEVFFMDMSKFPTQEA